MLFTSVSILRRHKIRGRQGVRKLRDDQVAGDLKDDISDFVCTNTSEAVRRAKDRLGRTGSVDVIQSVAV